MSYNIFVNEVSEAVRQNSHAYVKDILNILVSANEQTS